MGLCKCPKRKTTSHFCFHHCVNVCEHCIVNNHTTCTVKSYTTWLKEASGGISSSSATAAALCAVCQKQFVLTSKEVDSSTVHFNGSRSNTKTPIRLLCYHVVHAHCLSSYVKKQFKERNILKCPSCDRELWIQKQEQSQVTNDNSGVDSNDLTPVASLLYKHLLDNGSWWGQALITNENVNDIEKYLLEDELHEPEEESDEEVQQFENYTSQTNIISDNKSPITPAEKMHLADSNIDYYNHYELAHTVPDVTTINYRNNTNQIYQPIHHRHFNNNYGQDSALTLQQLQHQQQQLLLQQKQCSSVNMTTVAQSSDLNNRHVITSITPLLNNENNLNHDEQQDPSGKYRPKKFNNQSWSLSYRRLLQYFRGTNNKAEDNSTTRIVTRILFCLLIIVVLLVAITSYTRSNNEPFDNNSIDYAGDDIENNVGSAATNLKSFNVNNL
ncbi:zinc finger protein-like 1 [Rhopalosiphum maidis]|uniref:zinc finger protein-like 1 n=1 Tax=Rhopalosiphum maidis TaxID=43146 RepID=UPI000EFFE5DD|nr:zinc finger protein-like 1 [Rhopalosiphum maidis]XP_026816362.1 zinc finger protein-like 1 [Rhopalosiphum maidis]